MFSRSRGNPQSLRVGFSLNLKERCDCGKSLLLVSGSLLVLELLSVEEPGCPAVDVSAELIADSLKVDAALSISVL